MHTTRTTIIVLLLLSLASLICSLDVGSVPLNFKDLLSISLGHGSSAYQQIILELRLPRTMSAFVAGGLLSLAGALLQVLLRNPLADPYVLGISGGAAIGALSAMLWGFTGFWFSASTWIGALFSMLLIFSLARDLGHSATPTRLLLTGVIVAAGWGALISLILSVSPNEKLHGMLFWLMGDLSYAHAPRMEWMILIGGLGCSMLLARQLNILARGELQAQSLGVSTSRLRWQLYVLSSLLTATAVTLAGGIGFIGLVVPHLLRFWSGSDHRLLLPASVLLGGTMVVIADMLARSLWAPQQLPVGVLTALIGVPLFLYLLRVKQ